MNWYAMEGASILGMIIVGWVTIEISKRRGGK